MLKVTSLFSGIGGIDLGLEATGYYKTTLFSENRSVLPKDIKKALAQRANHTRCEGY